jgi:hypothetical protein
MLKITVAASFSRSGPFRATLEKDELSGRATNK